MHNTNTEKLKSLAEESYREFTQRLIPDGKPLLGVRMAPLRALAKTIAQDDWRSYVTDSTSDFFHEETLLRALVLAYAQIPETERLVHIEKFIPKIDNWAICDSFCVSLTSCKTHQQLYLPFLKKYLDLSAPYTVRFAVVMLLNHFMDPEYMDTSLSLLERVTLPNYYVQMAVAWATATAFTTNPTLTQSWIESLPISDEIIFMAMQKIRDSRQVSPKHKEWAGNLRSRLKAKS